MYSIPTHHPANLGIGQHIYGITAAVAAARHPANYGCYRAAQGADTLLILFGQQVGPFGRFFTVQGAGQHHGRSFGSGSGGGTGSRVASVGVGEGGAEDGVAEQLGGFVRMAAVLPEGVADQGGGIGGEGVAGYLKAALTAQAAGQYGGDGLEGAVLAPAHAPFLFGLLRLFDPCAGFGLGHGVTAGFGLPEVMLGLLFLLLGFFGPVAAVGLGGTDDVGAGLGDGALPLQQALQVGQCGYAFIGTVQPGADTECLGGGTLAADADVAIACGSQRIALEDPERADGFRIIRREAPHAFVLANVGPTVTPEQALRAVEMVRADALQIHLNAAQELIMPEGDRDFRDWAKRIAAIVATVPVPVVAKEVGFGLSRRTIMTLERTGVTAVDVAGAGGTDFIAIENERRHREYAYLTGWGQSAPLCLLDALCGRDPVGLPVLASGGVRNPLDVVRSLALGARAVGVSGHFLHTLTVRGADGLLDELHSWTDHVRTLMTLLGAADVDHLRRTDVLVTGPTRERARLLGVDPEVLARRSERR